MAIRKSLLLAGAATTVSLAGIGAAMAASGSAGSSNLVDNIASHFHLDKAAVQQVVDQTKQQNQTAHEQKYEDRLAKAVTDGKITAAQKDLILAKHNELVSTRQSLKGKTPAERRAALTQERTDLQAWEKANNIPAGYLMDGSFGRLR